MTAEDPARHRTLHKELRRGESPGYRRGEVHVIGRTGERVQSVDVLALDLKGLATGRQNMDLRRRRENLRRERRDGLDKVLARVEDQ